MHAIVALAARSLSRDRNGKAVLTPSAGQDVERALEALLGSSEVERAFADLCAFACVLETTEGAGGASRAILSVAARVLPAMRAHAAQGNLQRPTRRNPYV